ncbi:Uncharacterised protein [Aedoeadaptatus ivorii]|uniref:Uncharacterized protein n=1 Tax=Aedoeadaptatus ivorii TaxID=54006 RepID=A0A3S4YN83_9FIRM|nr:hypothetical protein [Peptoniphilus ivorii]MDQ0508461.1 hypothetical protein [Peptoniphilus ivorii]VEJ34216.1 Uncharacterised protein [Peptoniphilus ivorii]
MEDERREWYLKSSRLPDENGRLETESDYSERMAPGDVLWLIDRTARAYRVQAVYPGGLILHDMGIEEDTSRFPDTDAIFGAADVDPGAGLALRLPATRPSYELVPLFPRKPIAVEVEHRETSGPGEMIIELYDKKDPRPLRRSGDDELDRLMADSFETLLRLQLKNLEASAEIGEMWIKYLKYKRGKG